MTESTASDIRQPLEETVATLQKTMEDLTEDLPLFVRSQVKLRLKLDPDPYDVTRQWYKRSATVFHNEIFTTLTDLMMLHRALLSIKAVLITEPDALGEDPPLVPRRRNQ